MIKTINDFDMFELSPRYSSQKSFYGKAFVIERNGALFLRSYSTIVCGVVNGRFVRYWDGWTQTSGRHIHEFAMQFAGCKMGKSDWNKLPVEVWR